MPETLEKLERFVHLLDHWLAEKGHQDLKALLAPESNPTFSTQLYWQAFLKADLRPALGLERVAKALSGLGSYASPKQIQTILEGGILAKLGQEEKVSLSQRLLILLKDLPQWLDGSRQRTFRERPGAELLRLTKEFRFQDAQQAAQFSSQLGLEVPYSSYVHRAFMRFLGQGMTFEKWLSLLLEYFGDAQKAQAQDRLWHALFAGQSMGLLPRLCQDHPQCEPCPLSEECRLFQANKQSNAKAPLERRLLAGDEGISQEDLIAYLLDTDFSPSELQKHLLESFEGLRLMDSYDPHRSEADQSFFLKAKALHALLEQGLQGPKLEEGKVLNSRKEIYEHFRTTLAQQRQESFCIVLLDSDNKILRISEVSKGTLDQALVHPREVFAPAIQLRAASLMLVHNHPSGNLDPSEADVRITKRLVEAGRIIGIEVVDHIILSTRGYLSFGERGLMHRMK